MDKDADKADKMDNLCNVLSTAKPAMSIRYGKTNHEMRKQGEKGAAVIETVLCLTVFMAVIFTILGFINLCRAQAVVSLAVDATAKEMSQYAYLYHLTGLDSLEKNLLEKTAEDRKKFNDIAGATEAMYSVFSDMGNDIAGLVNSSLAGATGGGSLESIINSSLGGSSGSLAALPSSIEKLSDAISAVDNPMGFFKSVGIIAGLEGASIVKTRLIAVPLAKALVKKHFEVGRLDADDYLRSLRIDGLDALNFNMSTVFAPTTPEDIHLVVYYQVKAFNFFNFEFPNVTLCKESVTRAWLGGDTKPKAKTTDTSVWGMGALSYGKHIVGAEKENLVAMGAYATASMTGVDAFDPGTNTWITIRGMDTFSATYLADPDNILKELKKEYTKVSDTSDKFPDSINVLGSDGEKTSVSSPSVGRNIKIIVVVPAGGMTGEFAKALDDFRALYGNGSIEAKEGYGQSPKETGTGGG